MIEQQAYLLGYLHKTAEGLPEENIFSVLLRYLSAKAGKSSNPKPLTESQVVEM
jgi:hypothetical protein